MTKLLILMSIWVITIPLSVISYAAPLNDTGITQCGNASSNSKTCPQAGFPGQDAEYGRDVDNNDNSDGHAGFSFTKLDSNGNALSASASIWSCVKDNTTGLIWEVKTDDGGLRDKDWTYTWYNSTGINDGGSTGMANGGSCYDSSNCDTEKFVQQVNAQGLCDANDWRLPDSTELMSLVSLDRYYPKASIDNNFFPNTITSFYWTASPSPVPFALYSNYVWVVHFGDGSSESGANKFNDFYIHLVRAGQ